MLIRYSRQMALLGGSASQTTLSNSSVCVVGAGGIGSTVILYLVGAGVGRISVVDPDHVEESNLHRQIIHEVAAVGMNKAQSAVTRARALNPEVSVTAVPCTLTTENALDLLRGFDVIVDATDNYQARYVMSDACVMLGLPLVSGSAIGFEGQITVLCMPNGPCHRCLYPSPSTVESCRSCVNSGVLGPVPGLIGCMQATEVLKLLVASSNCSMNLTPLVGKQVYYDGMTGECNTYELKAQNPECASCGAIPTICNMQHTQAFIDAFERKMLAARTLPVLPQDNSISVQEYYKLCHEEVTHVLLDVRSAEQFELQHLPNTPVRAVIGIPLKDLTATRASEAMHGYPRDTSLFVVCRRGFDSVRATDLLLQGDVNAVNVTGGLEAWRRDVDPSFVLP